MENVERDEKVDGKGEDEDEERKIEQFFALIRGFREAQNKRKNELMEMEERRKRKRKMDEEQSSWVPTFRIEDFNEEIEFRRAPIIATAGRRREDQKVEDKEDDGGLNLKLTL